MAFHSSQSAENHSGRPDQAPRGPLSSYGPASSLEKSSERELTLSRVPGQPAQQPSFNIVPNPGEENDEDDGDQHTRPNHVEPPHLEAPDMFALRGASSKSQVFSDSIAAGVIPALYLRLNSAVTPSTTSPVMMRTSWRSYLLPSMRRIARPSRSACPGHLFHSRPIKLPMYPDTT